MENEAKAVEAGAGEAAAASSESLEQALAAKDAEIAQIRQERDNYRKGMLKAKGKLKEDDSSEEGEETLDDKVNRLLAEKLLDSKEREQIREKDELVKQALARVKELETAVKNRSQIPAADAGSGAEGKMTVKDRTLSDDKIAALKAKGWDDKKIERFKKNLSAYK